MKGIGYKYLQDSGVMPAAGTVRQAMSIEDNRPSVNNRLLSKQMVRQFAGEGTGMMVGLQKPLMQFVHKPGANKKRKRPSFMKNVRWMRKHIAKSLALGPYDMAHRLSYSDIEQQVEANKNDPDKLRTLIRDITIPQRKFGNISKGDKAYYVLAMKYKSNPDKLIKVLNSSPYNLRPGDQSKNRSIGASADLHYVKAPPPLKRTLTPQSSVLKKWALSNKGESSDFMTQKQFETFEKGIKVD